MSIKISELPSAEAVNNGDYLAIVQDGTTKKATASMLSADIATTINSSSTNNTAAGAKAVYDYAAPKKHDSTAQTYGVGTDEKYGHVMLVDDLNSSSLQAGKALSSHQGYVIKGLLDDKQDIINGYNKIDADYVDDTTSENKFVTEEQIQEIEELKAENEMLLDQIPTATAESETIHVEDSSNLPIKDFAMLGNATQADTPTPDTPQDIHVVTGDNTVKVLGKNLMPFTNQDFTKNNVRYYVQNGSLYLNGTSTSETSSADVVFKNNFSFTLPAGTYTLSHKTGVVGVYLRKASDNASIVTLTTNTATISVTLEETTEVYIGFYVYQASFSNIKTEIMLELGSTATDYEPYTETTQLLSLGSIELAKILDTDYKDRIFKAVSSNNPLKPSYYDTLPSEVKASLTVGSWYKRAEVGKGVIDGNTSIVAAALSGDLGNRFYTTKYSSTVLPSANNAAGKILSNMLTAKSANATYSGTEGISIDPSGNILFYMSSYKNYTAEQIKTWLGSNNMNIYFALATPTYTEITDTTLIGQLENAEKMRTIRNTTNGWIEPTGTNTQAGMVLVYRQDLATLISAN